MAVGAVAEVALAGLATALATGIGALPVGRVDERAVAWKPVLPGAPRSCSSCCSSTRCTRASRSAQRRRGHRGLGLFVLVAIAVQNIPQGTVTAIPLAIVAIDVAPDAWSAGSRVRATIGAAAGTALMVACALLLNVP